MWYGGEGSGFSGLDGAASEVDGAVEVALDNGCEDVVSQMKVRLEMGCKSTRYGGRTYVSTNH